ncbi:MAG: ABC transporter permease [Pyrinomonadaceae bacterium]
MSGLWQDLRYAVRMMRKSPGFTAVAVLSLALGIGANTAIFSLVNAALLRPLPIAQPKQIVALYTSDASGAYNGNLSYSDYADFRDKNESLSGLAAYMRGTLNLNDNGRLEAINGEIVSGNYFDVLGVSAARGRTFLPEEDATPGTHPVAVISSGLWRRRFGSDSGAVGKTVVLSGQSFTVIGIAPESFTGLARGLMTDIWIPAMMSPQVIHGANLLTDRNTRLFGAVGRLKPDATLAEARANFDVIARRMQQAYPDEWSYVDDNRRVAREITLLPESKARILPQIRGAVTGFLSLLMIVAGLVLIIACTNLASLLLARAAGRRKEVAIRFALGASRARIIRQMMTESLLLSLTGGVCGLLVALWCVDLLMAFKPSLPVALTLDLSLDYRVLGFTMIGSVLTGVLFGVAPALRASSPNAAPALKFESGAFFSSYRKSRLRNLLVIAQIALSLMLLVGAGLFVRSLLNANAINTGFKTDNLLLTDFNVGRYGYDEAKGQAFYEQLMERVNALPGVASVSLMYDPVLMIDGFRRKIEVEGYASQPGENLVVNQNFVGPDYLRTMGIPLVRGRDFTERDRAGASGVIIINETMARRFFPGTDALGKRIRADIEGAPLEIVGIAKDSKYRTLGEAPLPFCFLPLLQNYQPRATLLVRTVAEPSSMIGGVRNEALAIDKSLPAPNSKTMIEHLSFALFPARIGAFVLGSLGFIALALAAIGIFGVVSYSVAQRTHEIGIRLAIGASPRDILKLILRQGMMVVSVGLGVGVIGALIVTRALASLLYGVGATDLLTFVSLSLLLGFVSLLACYIPARRAMKVDPMVALRHE